MVRDVRLSQVSLAIVTFYFLLYRLVLIIKNSYWGCRHSSVDSSAPTILLPRVRVPSTSSTLFHLQYLCYIFHVKRMKIKQKEARFGPFFKKRIQTGVDHSDQCWQFRLVSGRLMQQRFSVVVFLFFGATICCPKNSSEKMSGSSFYFVLPS